MKGTVLATEDRQLIEIPRNLWEQHAEQSARDIPKVLKFMTTNHHQIRYFVVRELPRIGKPIPPDFISRKLNIPLSKTIEILDDLERNLFFLTRNESGEVLWAYPVTVDHTPHRLTFSTGERLNAA